MMPGSYTDGPRLLADIGGTNARFALEYAPGSIATMVITAPYPALAGAAAVLDQHLCDNPGNCAPQAALATSDTEMDLDHASH